MITWTRTAPDRIERGPCRIDKSHVGRVLGEPAPVYHAFLYHAFLGAFPSAEAAQAECDRHLGASHA